MLTYLWHRLRYLPLSMLGVIFVTFCVLRLTGNPVDIYLDMNRTPEQVAAMPHSHTGRFLAPLLEKNRARSPAGKRRKTA